ncbi:hypothetical protein [Clostridium sp.]|uniref:hypothetical protein n=1 Tax=Clostridium sp. TaxID=1506 RepID=UPI0026070DBA|nr:hypothetical protein [Clostridium sp.]
MNYTKVKFEIYLSDTYLDKFINELDNLGSLCLGYEKNNYFIILVSSPYEKQISDTKISTNPSITTLHDNIKLEFQCDKDIALEVINLIKKVHLSKHPIYNISPIIN